MNLPGLLGATTLGDLLGRLYRGGVDGVLELVERGGHRAGRVHRIHFDRGLIDGVETELGVPRLGEVLVQRGALAPESARRVQPATAPRARRIGQTLIAERLVSPGAVRQALRDQLGLRLDALFELKDALIRFHVRRAGGRDADAPEPLTPREFLNGRPRKRSGGPWARPRCSAAERAALRVLGLEPGARVEAVRRAFRQRARELHPDRHPQLSGAERAELLGRFAELSRAYHTLVASPSTAGSSSRDSTT